MIGRLAPHEMRTYDSGRRHREASPTIYELYDR